jgi:hypothetical protein
MERRSTELSRAILVVAGAIAVGTHAGLAPNELREWAPLGVSFVAAACALAVAVVVLAVGRGDDKWAAGVLALLFVGLVAGYVATRIVALPPLDPDPEPIDAIGVATTAVEAAGVLAALHLARREPTSSTSGGKQRPHSVRLDRFGAWRSQPRWPGPAPPSPCSSLRRTRPQRR